MSLQADQDDRLACLAAAAHLSRLQQQRGLHISQLIEQLLLVILNGHDDSLQQLAAMISIPSGADDACSWGLASESELQRLCIPEIAMLLVLLCHRMLNASQQLLLGCLADPTLFIASEQTNHLPCRKEHLRIGTHNGFTCQYWASAPHEETATATAREGAADA